jgi:hypothetical protein
MTGATKAGLVSVASWRQEAVNLRALAAKPHLSDEQAAALLRQADAADRQADWWHSSMLADGESTT